MINVEKNSIVEVKWNVLPMDYSREEQQNIKHKLSKKLNIPLRNVKVSPNFIMVNEKGETVALTNETIVNIQNPQFQIKLFKDYLALNNKTDFNMDTILSIDAEINNNIDYDVYSKYKQYKIKWIKWSNFLSYGKDNFFDFTQLHGLCLINGKPSNQTGKTTFAVELLRFLLFGKTSKFKTLEQNFNLNLPNETELVVEGEVEIENVSYIIKRTLSRPSVNKRSAKSKVNQKVEYFQINPDGNMDLLESEENCEEETGSKTNRAIKDAIGNEQDFDLIICATNDNLRDLISFKDTDRGRLLSRWIGLLPLEEKDKIAREKFNKEVNPKFISNVYNREQLLTEIEDFKVLIKSNKETLKIKNTLLADIDKNIETYKTQYNILAESKRNVDDTLLMLDINTHKKLISDIKEKGVRHKAKKEQNKQLLEETPKVEFSEKEYISLIEERIELKHKMISLKEKIEILKRENVNLASSEFCPTCKRKYENVDNSPLIAEKNETIKKLTEEGVVARETFDKRNEEIKVIEQNKKDFDFRSKLIIENESLDLLMDNLRSKLINANQVLKNYDSNKESIDYNNKINIEINNVKIRIFTEEKSRDNVKSEIQSITSELKNYESSITKREGLIVKIAEEEELKKNWAIYLELVGKNGISKMVLKNTLPIINAELKRLLVDVCNFDVEISINEKNDVAFYYTKENCEKALISGSSGLEKTIASLALRAVLAKISTMPRLNFIVMDEVFSSSIASENYEKVKIFFDRILTNYDFILHVTFVSEIVDWHEKIITITNENAVSRIVGTK